VVLHLLYFPPEYMHAAADGATAHALAEGRCTLTDLFRSYDAASTRATAQLYANKQAEDPMMNVPNMLSASLGKRWRAERNFWISALTLFSWV